MTTYNVHIYREMRLFFERIEAETPEAAAAIARDKLTSDADDIDDCNGEDLGAMIDAAGDEDYGQSVGIDFESERQRKAAPRLLAACDMVRRAYAGDGVSIPEAVDACLLAIAEAEAAAIPSQPAAPGLLAALSAVLPYAWSERDSLRECWKRDGDPKVKKELEACDRAVDQATAAIAASKSAGITPPADTGNEPRPRFEIEHDPKENADRIYVLVDGKFDVAIIRTAEGLVVDVYRKDSSEMIGTTYAFASDADAAEPEEA
jgi:hypothetical protein